MQLNDKLLLFCLFGTGHKVCHYLKCMFCLPDESKIFSFIMSLYLSHVRTIDLDWMLSELVCTVKQLIQTFGICIFSISLCVCFKPSDYFPVLSASAAVSFFLHVYIWFSIGLHLNSCQN